MTGLRAGASYQSGCDILAVDDESGGAMHSASSDDRIVIIDSGVCWHARL